MVGFLQIMIWFLCAYLVFKGVEIFQIAWTSSVGEESADGQKARSMGLILGVVMIGVVVVATGVIILLEESKAVTIQGQAQNLLNR